MSNVRFKKTRIVFSLFCGLLCLLLIGWWVQGQSTSTFVTCNVSPWWSLQIGCLPGSLFLYSFSWDESDYGASHENVEFREWAKSKRWEVESYPADQMVFAYPTDSNGNYSTLWGSFSLLGEPKAIPFWFVTLLTGMAATATFPWRHLGWRFSLRTLLITTTAAAVGLWFIMWIARK
jgi:hypothetical protein